MEEIDTAYFQESMEIFPAIVKKAVKIIDKNITLKKAPRLYPITNQILKQLLI